MHFSKLWLLAIGLISAAALMGTLTAAGAEAPTQPAQATYWQEKGCTKAYSRKTFHRVARNVFRSARKLSTHQRKLVRRVAKCQHSARSARIIKWHLRRYQRRHNARVRQRLAIIALTPYGPCYGGRWAVPCSIIFCESKGSWKAANGSGAIGPYQFLGKRIVWPVRTQAHRLAHHRLASNLWRGGAGRSHWAQCL
jgi:hypothetical protein